MRYVFLILVLLVLAAPFAVRKALVKTSGTTAFSGAERLVVLTPHNSDIRNEFARAFAEWHREKYGVAVELDLRVPGGTNDIKRQLETTYRAYLNDKQHVPPPEDVSVVWGGGDYFFNQLKAMGILQSLHMSPAMLEEFRKGFPHPTLAGVKLYDPTAAPNGTPTPLWVGVCLSSFGICYNPDVYHGLGLPEPSAAHGWSDLTNPRLFNYLALADPAHSASASVAYQMVIQHKMAEAESAFFAQHPAMRSLAKKELAGNDAYRRAISDGWDRGMSELLKIAANTRYFTDSSTLPPMDVSRGETAAGISIDFYARVTEESVGSDRLHYIAPVGATAITPDPVAILVGVSGRKLELADHFVEFLLSRQGQLLWILKPGQPDGPIDRALRRPPIRQDLYQNRTGWADDANPYAESAGFNQRGEWMALFDDTRPIWVAAWIDARDDLKSAYAKILSLSDATLREKLINELAALPIHMKDVEALKKQAASAPDVDYWRAKERVEWAEKFRAHYRDVAEQVK